VQQEQYLNNQMEIILQQMLEVQNTQVLLVTEEVVVVAEALPL
jgi:hypothetical protein